MLSVRGIYDGKKLKLFERVKINTPKKVIVTFLETENNEITNEEIQLMAEKGGGFDFLHDEKEDIYTDKDLKVKY